MGQELHQVLQNTAAFTLQTSHHGGCYQVSRGVKQLVQGHMTELAAEANSQLPPGVGGHVPSAIPTRPGAVGHPCEHWAGG